VASFDLAPRPLGLHQMNALEVSGAELVSMAYEVGCQYVCAFVQLPPWDVPFEAVPPAMVHELLARMDATGVTLRNVEIFALTEDVDVGSFRPALELGAQLGAQGVNSIMMDTVETRAAANFATLCELAAELDLNVSLEFSPLTPGCTSLESAAKLLRLIGKPNAGLAVDALHLVRGGGTPEDVAAQPAELFAHAQLCDGPDLAVGSDYLAEAFERLVPGEGVFPIAAILDALPAATPVELEVPSLSSEQNGIPALDRARRAAKAARELLNRAQPTR
jgi:sugar phosphate isomerase/epimerase